MSKPAKENKAGVTVKVLLSPGFLMSCVCMLVFSLVLLFNTGFLKSFRLDFSELSVSGQIVFFASLLCVCVAMAVGTLLGDGARSNNIACFNHKKANQLILLFLVLSSIAVLMLSVELVAKYGLVEFLYGSLRGYIKDDPLFDSRPYLAFSMLPLLSGPLCVLNRLHDRKYHAHLLWGFVNSLLFALMYSSRIIMIEYMLFCAVVWLRCTHFNTKIKTSVIIAACIALAGLMVVTSAVRDYESSGVVYTDNPVEWGISRNIDYPLSAYEYSVFLLEEGGVRDAALSDLVPTLGRISDDYGSSSPFADSNRYRDFFLSNNVGAREYTNRGAIGSIFQLRPAVLGLILLSVYVIFCTVSWRAFSKGSLFGLLSYPVCLYSIIEFWRYAVFLTEIPQLLVLLTVLICIYLKNSNTSYVAR